MNVAFEQIRRKFDVPKGVMHYLVHHVRPRAPGEPPGDWSTWLSRNGIFLFGEWTVVVRAGIGAVTAGRGITYKLRPLRYYCSYCLAGPFVADVVCGECAEPVLREMVQDEDHFLAVRDE